MVFGIIRMAITGTTASAKGPITNHATVIHLQTITVLFPALFILTGQYACWGYIVHCLSVSLFVRKFFDLKLSYA